LVEPIAKPAHSVTPAKAGVQNALRRLDSGFRRNDAEGLLQLAHKGTILIAFIISSLFVSMMDDAPLCDESLEWNLQQNAPLGCYYKPAFLKKEGWSQGA